MATVRQETAGGKRVCGLCGGEIKQGDECIRFYAFRDTANVCVACCKDIAEDAMHHNVSLEGCE